MKSADLPRPGSRPLGKLPAVRFRTPLPLFPEVPSGDDLLIRRLALDRLRDLREDGVTIAYIGRMYGVTADRMQQLEEELRR